MKNHIIPTTIGLLGGFILTAGLRGNLPLALAVSLPAAGLTYLVADTRATNRVNEVNRKLSKALGEVARLETVRSEYDAYRVSAAAQADRLNSDLESVRTALEIALQDGLVSQNVLSNVRTQLNAVQRELATAREERQEAIDALDALREGMDDEIEHQAHERFVAAKKAELSRVYAETDDVMARAMGLFERLQGWGEKVADAHEAKSATIRSMATQYNNAIDQLGQSVRSEHNAYVEQIEILHVKVARLQQEKAGNILEPRFYDGGYGIEANIANDLARLIFSRLGIALEVEGVRVRGGDIDVGFGYSQSADPQKLVATINSQLAQFKRSLGLAELYAARKYEAGNLIVIGFRREPKAQKSKIERMVEMDFTKLAVRLIQDLELKPTIRIMGSTGDGKGVCARSILSTICKEVEGWTIRLHDPQHGSNEDYWGIPKVSKSGSQMKANLKALNQQMEARESHTASKEIVTLDVLDEIDTQLSGDDKKNFLNLVSRIRHLNMKLILIGQNPKVGRAGFQWADMTQMTCIYMGASALDAINNHPQLKRKSEGLSDQFDEIQEWTEYENRALPTESRYLFGLLVTPAKKPQWFILPSASRIEIKSGSNTLAEKFVVANSNSAFVECQNMSISSPKALAESGRDESTSEAENLTGKAMAVISAERTAKPHVGVDGKTAESGKSSCKYHPSAELREQKDGRYYCPECKRKLKKDEVI